MTPEQAVKSSMAADYQPAPLWRRLAAMVYDTFLVIAIVMVTSGIYHAVVNNLLLGLKDAPAGFNPLLSTVLTFILFFFFAHFWTRGGQTLGMQAWKIRVISSETGGPLTLIQCLLRFMIAIPAIGLAGLGVLWILVDKDKKSWHDRYSRSQVILLTPATKV
ncbi:RDD family protein [Sansalvadorimonas sp. 2012CJ34-2]|uniref:RDD family protein n=1 Tax=Parendozoicomonas callyspongiae TaxID=2942213 RepID=A0ABT0PCE0_9GAMM|nr:RDD family protein [Sansalvadorimonas sp. 2012CJ34-2]MCL6269049.1 RDD family protein [Sansalvadorimonas sp. 2012CJ34-2]